MFVSNAAGRATFSPEKMTKGTLAQGESLFAGLNCFEAGQEHTLHAHPGQDKLYFILQGSALVTIGEESRLLSSGDAAMAPSGVQHAIRNPGPGRLVVMAILAPPPK